MQLFSVGELKIDNNFITYKTVQIVIVELNIQCISAILGRVGSLLSLGFASRFTVYNYSTPFSDSSQTVFVICGV